MSAYGLIGLSQPPPAYDYNRTFFSETYSSCNRLSHSQQSGCNRQYSDYGRMLEQCQGSFSPRETIKLHHLEEQMDSTNMLGSPMGVGSNSMVGSPPDMKPDISGLNSPTSTVPNHMVQGFFSMGRPPMSMQGMMPQQMSPTGMMHSTQMMNMQQQQQQMHSPTESMTSPTTSMTSPSSSMASPHHMPHSSLPNKHICAICGDRASGKHYGVYSCEGCKGFFKRTVRKDLTYACRDERNCIIDKRQRNRCQYCRYMKCLAMGMKREDVSSGIGSRAVQEERQRCKERGENEVESTSNANAEMPVERILEAELSVEPKTDTYIDTQKDAVTNICQAADKQLFTLVDWAKRIPHFVELPVDDQVILLRAGWNELLIAAFSHRSIAVKDGILLATGLHVHRSSAHQAGVGTIFDRVLTELVAKMREMKMDKTELGCLRAIVLYNPDAKGLSAVPDIEALREKVYASLEEYCKTQYPDEPGRFAKLLLRLPALRSIGLKCLEHLFFFKLIGDTPIDTFLMEMLENPSPNT